MAARRLRLPLAAAATLALAAGAGACSTGGTRKAPAGTRRAATTSGAPTGMRSGPCTPGNHWVRFTADNEPHVALLHVPRSARGRLPLVAAFHGARSGARFVSEYYGLSPLADKERFAVVYPQASHNLFWQLTTNQTEDVEAVRLLLDKLTGMSCVDPTRVYATGVSNGGGFTARLGCEMADRLAAIAPVAGGYAPLGPCHPARPLPVLEIHGTRDQVVPYGGKGPDNDGSVARFLGQWVELDGCMGRALRTLVGHGVTRTLWAECADGSVVEHLRLAGTNHGWPGGDLEAAGITDHPVPSQDPTGVHTADVVWDFLSRFRLPAPAAP